MTTEGGICLSPVNRKGVAFDPIEVSIPFSGETYCYRAQYNIRQAICSEYG